MAVLALLLALSVLSVPVAPSAAADDVDTTDRVRQLLEDGSTNADVGLFLREIGGPVHAAFNEGFAFEPASAIKALVHFHAMRQVQDATMVDGQPVTVDREIPWLARADKFDANGDYIPGGNDCAATNTVDMSTALLEPTLRWTMRSSDNATTQGLRDFFGDASIDDTRQALGMTDTVLDHSIGCGAEAAANPNALTLVDAGRMYEAAATWYLDESVREQAYGVMTTGASNFNAIVDVEAASLGLSSDAVSGFKAQRRSALKGGSYGVGGASYRSQAGWAELGFKDHACDMTPRGFVFGVFIHDADQAASSANVQAWAFELFREQIRKGLESWAACEADLEHVGVGFIDPPGEIDVNTPTPLTVRHVVRNNGPAAVIDADLRTLVTAPADCDVQPGVSDQALPALQAGVQTVVDTPVTVTCSEPSFHPVHADAWIAPAQTTVTDPDPANDASHDAETIAVIAQADLAVLDLDLGTLDGAGLGDLLVGDLFSFEAPLTTHNFGDPVDGLYDSPVDAAVSRTLAVPDGLTGAVEVGVDEGPATVVVQEGGQPPVVHANQPAGSVIEASGPATLTVHAQAPSLVVGSDRVVSAGFGLRCDAAGMRDVSFTAGIAPSDQHVVDAQPGNDTVQEDRTIECVTPVRINVRPGNAHNFVSPQSHQTVPVAILTTEAGEYRLPLAFNATAVDHSTVRFGAVEALNQGGGSSPSPDKAFVGDSFEMDDATKDGDLDLAVRSPVPGSGIGTDTTEACLVGTYAGAGGDPQTFFGCDTVGVPPGGGA